MQTIYTPNPWKGGYTMKINPFFAAREKLTDALEALDAPYTDGIRLSARDRADAGKWLAEAAKHFIEFVDDVGCEVASQSAINPQGFRDSLQGVTDYMSDVLFEIGGNGEDEAA